MNIKELSIFLLGTTLLLFACTNNDQTTETAEEVPVVRSMEELQQIDPTTTTKVVYEITTTPEVERAKLYESVLDASDELMPILPQLTTLRMEMLKAHQTAYLEQNTPVADSLETLIKRSQVADKSVWEWKHAFVHPSSSQPQDEVMAYLNEEKEKIATIKMTLQTVLDEGQQYIKDLSTIYVIE